MPLFQCPNPQCATRSEIPEKFLGVKVCCKKCRTEFVAGTPPVKAAPPPPPLTSKVRPAPVVAFRKGAAGNAAGRLAAGLLAFLVPVLAAGGASWFWLAPKPASPPDLYAGIEVGSKGVTYVVYEVTLSAGGKFDYRVLHSESRNTNINGRLAQEGVFDPEGMKASVKAVRQCYQKLRATDHIPAERIYLVSSGGLLAALDTRPARDELREKNRAALKTALRAAVARDIDFIDAPEEAGYQLAAVVGPGRLEESVYIDLGSGGTRGAYRDGAGRLRRFDLAGNNEFVAQAKQKPGVELAKSLIAARYAEKAKEAEGFDRRKHVYIGGGIVWMLTLATCPDKQVAPPEKGLHVTLTAAEVETFVANVRAGKDFRDSFEPPADLPPEQAEKLRAEVARSRKPFPPPALAAGAEILASLSSAMAWPQRTLEFPRYANVSWIIGYIAKQNGWKR